MSDWLASMAFESAFKPPHDCRIHGDVSCRVVDSSCEIIDKWCDRVTLKVTLRLRLAIRSGGLLCRFERRVVIKETVWCSPDAWIAGCKVTAAICRCRMRKGLVICVGAVQVRIHLRRPEPFCPCACPTPCSHVHTCTSGCSADCSSDWSGGQDCLSGSISEWDSDGSSHSESIPDCGCSQGPPPDRPYRYTPTRSNHPGSRRVKHC